MSEDIFHVIKEKIVYNDETLINDFAYNFCLQYIDLHCTRYGKSLDKIPGMPQYNTDLIFENLGKSSLKIAQCCFVALAFCTQKSLGL
jgi:hypothetical protein